MVEEYLRVYDQRQRQLERRQLERVKQSYELVRQDEQLQRENQFFDEIEFDCAVAMQIYPSFFTVCVHRERNQCQLVRNEEEEGERMGSEEDRLLG